MNIDTDIPIEQLLVDIHPKTGKVIDWAKKKKQTDEIATACHRIASDPDLDLRYSAELKNRPRKEFKNRANRLLDCGEYLEFKHSAKTGENRLHKAFFCKYRLCPMCSWRRSLKNYGQLSQVMDVGTSEGYRYLFATMSIQNCYGEDLKEQITDLYKGFTNLGRRQAVKKRIHGTMRTLEVTHNLKIGDPWFDTYNAHIHALFAVKPRYFKKDYLTQAKWLEFWKKSMKVDYEPHFHIQAVKKGKDGGAAREVSKYATKPSHILTDDHDLTDSAIWYLDRALENRRLVSYTGILKRIKADLKLDDVESGDLVHVDGEQELNPELEWTIQRFKWSYGYGQYTKFDG